ncbi:MAG: tripartite tricarboxylate transporter substrate binding protein [Betaproteobacteria bacterium]
MRRFASGVQLVGAAILIGSVVTTGAVAADAAKDYPSHPIRFIVPVAPGGGTDYMARLMAQMVGDKWGQTIVPDNRPGATGLIGMKLAAEAPADGYTAIVFNIGHLMSTALAKNSTVDTARDFIPVSLIATGTLMLAVNPSVPVANVTEFIAYAKAHPGKLNYASGGPGGTQHLAMELLKREAHIDLTHVPYKGSGPGTFALLSGQVEAFITNILALYPHVKAGKLKALAVANPKRNPLLPDVPTFAEAGYPGVEVNLWQGIMVPAHTPRAIVNKLSRAIVEAVHTPDASEKMATQGAEPAGTSPREFADFLQSERNKWLALVRDAHITVN